MHEIQLRGSSMKNKNLAQEDDIGFRAIGWDGFYLSAFLRGYTF
jgi:hypothetical protein